LLRVIFENFLLSVGGKVEATEIASDDSTLAELQAKGQRLGFLPKGKNAFAQIQKISGVPDIGEAFAAKRISSNQILDLRHLSGLDVAAVASGASRRSRFGPKSKWPAVGRRPTRLCKAQPDCARGRLRATRLR
jgi:hypothetical protein